MRIVSFSEYARFVEYLEQQPVRGMYAGQPHDADSQGGYSIETSPGRWRVIASVYEEEPLGRFAQVYDEALFE